MFPPSPRYHFLLGDNILTAISVGRDCGLIKPDQTVIRVEAELGGGQYMPNLNVSYTLEEKSNIVRDVSSNSFSYTPRGCRGQSFVFSI